MTKKLVLAIVAVVFVGAAPNRQDIITSEMAAFEGKWILTEVLLGWHREKPSADDAVEIWTIRGERVTRSRGSKKIDSLKLEFKPIEKPKHLDLVPIEGEEAKHRQERMFGRTKCIYRLKGNELTIAREASMWGLAANMSDEELRKREEAEPRPTGFSTLLTQTMVMKFKREEKKRR